MLEKIKEGLYFVLKGPPQSGKTSFLLELRDYLNGVDTECAALYLNLEFLKGPNLDREVAAILDNIDDQCSSTFNVSFNTKNATKHLSAIAQLEEALTIISQEVSKCGKKFVLLIDEIDLLVGDVLLNILMYNSTLIQI